MMLQEEDQGLSMLLEATDLKANEGDSMSTEVVEKMVAKEIGRMPQNHRDAIQEEIHGVSNMAIEETPELLETSLQSFQAELDSISLEDRFAYDCIANQEANPRSRRILVDRDFRLRFLRCTFFKPREAAQRFIDYFQVLYAVYGREAILRFDTTMDFFVGEKKVRAAFREGYLQLLPFRDRSGRKILVLVMDALHLDDATRLKIFLYLVFVAGNDVETQRSGIVMLFWPGCQKLKLPTNRHKSLVVKLLQGGPTRFASFHFCFPDTPIFRMVQAVLLFLLIYAKGITRVKVHTGERVEIQYQLMGYGIPVNLIPTTTTGTLKTKNFVQWVNARKLLESHQHQQLAPDDLDVRIECPGLRDVIFRSAGKSCMLNPGNVTFRGMFERYHDEHIQAGQTEKKQLVWRIVQAIEFQGGRFLVWDKRGWWVPLVDRAEIRNKVAISLRGYNKQRKADENRQSLQNCSTHAFEGQDGSLETFITQRSPKRRKCQQLCENSDSDESRQSCGFIVV